MVTAGRTSGAFASGSLTAGFLALLVLGPLAGAASAQIPVGQSDWQARGVAGRELAIVEQQMAEVAKGANLSLTPLAGCTESDCTQHALSRGLSRYLYLEIEDIEDKGLRVRIRVVDALANRPLGTRSVPIQKNDRRGTRSALEASVRDLAFHLFGPPVPDTVRASAASQLASRPPPEPAAPVQPASPPVFAREPEPPPRAEPPKPEPPAVSITRQPVRYEPEEAAPPRAEPVVPAAPKPAPRPVATPRATEPPPLPEPVRQPEPVREPEPEPEYEPPRRQQPADERPASERIIPDKIDIPYLP